MAKGPPCTHWKACSGCPLIRYDYRSQLKQKFQYVQHAFIDHGFKAEELRGVMQPVKAAPLTLGYRNKAKWILQMSGGELKMGIYRAGTHEVVDIPNCAVHAPEINELSAFIKSELVRNRVPCGNERLPEPTLRYVIVRYSFREKKLLVVFITSTSTVPGLDTVVKTLEAAFGERVNSIVQNINSDAGNVLLGEANKYLRKKGDITETMGAFRVPIGPLSFLQVNSLQASYLYNRVKKLIGPGPFQGGLDLYSGVGLIAMHLAKSTKRILAVEEVGAAALESITAVRRNRIHNIMQICGDALEGIATFLNEWGAPDWAVLNPPRKGCEEDVLSAVASRPPGKLVYVSCNPMTLARDLSYLMKATDLKLRHLEPVDMFPQTEHIECIALLENRSFKRGTRIKTVKEKTGPKPASKAIH